MVTCFVCIPRCLFGQPCSRRQALEALRAPARLLKLKDLNLMMLLTTSYDGHDPLLCFYRCM